MHLVSAWAVECGVSLGQLATEEKSNEITAIPQLLEQVELQGSVVTIDAAGCQKEIAARIVQGGGDYCLAPGHEAPPRLPGRDAPQSRHDFALSTR